MRFKAQTAPESINTNNGPMQKTTIVLAEVGGKYADSYAAVYFGNPPSLQAGQLVAVDLRFVASEHNGRYFQDCVINEIVQLG